jgi:hypothetical protein
MMNGFLPTSTPVRVMQWWRSRDQGDSLAVAQGLADNPSYLQAFTSILDGTREDGR